MQILTFLKSSKSGAFGLSVPFFNAFLPLKTLFACHLIYLLNNLFTFYVKILSKKAFYGY